MLNPTSGICSVVGAWAHAVGAPSRSTSNVVGGVGSLRGAVIGGLALGIVESMGMARIPTEWQNSIAFVVLFVVLLVRPTGLFGGR